MIKLFPQYFQIMIYFTLNNIFLFTNVQMLSVQRYAAQRTKTANGMPSL